MIGVASVALALGCSRWLCRPYPCSTINYGGAPIRLDWTDGRQTILRPGDPYPKDWRYGWLIHEIGWSDGTWSWHLHLPTWPWPGAR